VLRNSEVVVKKIKGKRRRKYDGALREGEEENGWMNGHGRIVLRSEW
jgi:hypothetical protein